jgi:hypothetical protein
MDAQELRQCVNRIEECADEAKRAMHSGSPPQELRQCVEDMHQQAREAKQDGSGDEAALRGRVMQLEQTADRAMQACRSAGNVDPQLQQAVQRAHDEVSKLKKQMQAGSPA